jgi:hypothetical protein
MTELRRFNGPAYDPQLDQERLSVQYKRIFDLMKDAHWRTLGAIAHATGAPQASVSAQLRHMRKERFGDHAVNKKRIEIHGQRGGLWSYQLVINPGVTA